MRVLTVTSLYPNAAQPNHAVFVENRMRRVHETGEAEITVIAPTPWFPSKNKMFGSYATHAAVPKREERHGIRIDHLLANLALASSEACAEVELDIVAGSDRLFVVRGHRSFDLEVGQLVRLLPMHGAAQGVVTSGLRYPLAGEPLEPGSTRGLSNLAVATTISVEVAQGTLLAVMPDQTEPDQTGEER